MEKKQRILAKFSMTTGRWDGKINEYVDKLTTESEKEILMLLRHDFEGREMLQFVGGPTGHEVYYANDIRRGGRTKYAEETGNFCICGGTINTWPRCNVPMKEVLEFLGGRDD